jgi:hypothetical protein
MVVPFGQQQLHDVRRSTRIGRIRGGRYLADDRRSFISLTPCAVNARERTATPRTLGNARERSGTLGNAVNSRTRDQGYRRWIVQLSASLT